jgi:uncharacterized protein (TIGR02246 family)
MKTNSFFTLIAAFSIFAMSCQSPNGAVTDLSTIKEEIQVLENNWAAALNARDIETLMGMYTDDAISMPDGKPMLSGKDAIRKQQEEEFSSSPEGMTFEFETLDVYGTADLVTEIGKSTYKDSTGKMIGSGKYVAIWKKQDGQYLCIREIYNNDAPRVQPQM